MGQAKFLVKEQIIYMSPASCKSIGTKKQGKDRNSSLDKN